MGGLATDTNTYSGGSVNSTIPGQSFQQNQQSLVANADARLKSGQTLDPATVAALNQGYKGAQNLNVDLSLPQARQQALSDTQLGSMQNNYQDLAQQLASYDNAVLKPQFAGQNPGMPSDIQPGGDVTWGDVSYLTPGNAGLPAAQGIFNANPAYALGAQADQGNNILALLNTLNDAISKESKRGYDIYGGKLNSAASVLKGFSDILDKNMSLEQARASLALQASSRTDAKRAQVEEFAQKLQTQLSAGQKQWGDAWSSVDNYAKDHGVPLRAEEIDNLLGGSYNPTDPTGAKGLTTGWALPGAYENYLTNKSTEAVNRKVAIAPAQTFLEGFDTSSINRFGPQNKVSKWLIDNAGGAGVSQDIVSANQNFELLKQNVVRALQGARMSDQDIKTASGYIPTIVDTPDSARTKLNNLQDFLNRLSGRQTNIDFGGKNNTGGSGYTIIEVK